MDILTADTPRWLRIFHSIGVDAQKITDKWSGSKKAQTELGKGAGGDTTVWIDKAIENILVKQLAKNGNLRLISEEAGELVFGNPKLTVVADPLDGSNNAMLGIPIFAISLALACKDQHATLGDIELGYVRNLVTGQEYTAIRGKKAFCNGVKLATSKNKEINLLGLYLSRHTQPGMRRNISLINISKKVRSPGSIALDLCFVASGAFDAVVDLRNCIRTLDIAAGYIILKEAGGMFTDTSGKEIDNIVINPTDRVNILATGNRIIHRKLLESTKFL